MEYAVVSGDYGQGKGLTVLPVSRRKQLLDHRKASTVYDVLIHGYGEDPGLVLGNYIQMEKEQIQSAGILTDARKLRLLSYAYRLTESCIQQPVQGTVVDMIFRCTVEGDQDGGRKLAVEDFRVRYILDMRPCEQKCIGPLIFPCRKDEVPENRRIKTNDYLLPIIYTEDYERLAHEIIECYFPEDPERLDAEELAKRMGLAVRDVRFRDPAIMGQIYYDFATAELLDDAGRVYTARIHPGTILVSKDNCATPAARSSTIAHECSHMYLDRWHFLLQMMGGAKMPYTNRKKGLKGSFTLYQKKTPIDWMELQCEKISAYILMERDSTKKYIEKQLAGKRDPVSVRRTILSMAERYKVSKTMAKYRMAELGFSEAEGVFCYVNGISVPDHGCAGKWPDGVTYTIPLPDVTALAERDAWLGQALLSGQYLYVEGHVCRNQKKYAGCDRHGMFYLTSYARNHMDECCVAFRPLWRYREGIHHPGGAARNKSREVTDRYCSRYKLESAPEETGYTEENSLFFHDSMLWGEYFYEMADDYREAILDIMKKKGITQEKLSLELGVDRKVVYNFLNAGEPSVEHMVGVCVALKLPYFVSMKLIQNAGSALRRTELHHLYRQFLMQADRLSVERCNDILKQKKYPPLFQGKSG